MLTERGPEALLNASTPNLTLAHLKRILSGIEGKRVGGGLKLAGEEDGGEAVVDGQEEIDAPPAVELEDIDFERTVASQQLAQKPYSGKRALDIDAADTDPAPEPKKRKRKIISTPDAEGRNDPTNGTMLQATLPPSNQAQGQVGGEDDWQDAQTYALAQEKFKINDAAKPFANYDDISEVAGQNGMGSDEELESNAFDPGTAVETDRHPGADLPQPKSEKDEMELVSVTIERTGEVVDPRKQSEKNGTPKEIKKSKKSKDKFENNDDDVEVGGRKDRSHNVKQPKKKNKKSKDVTEMEDAEVKFPPDGERPKKRKKTKDQDVKGDVNMSRMKGLNSSQTSKIRNDAQMEAPMIVEGPEKEKKKEKKKRNLQPRDVDVETHSPHTSPPKSSQPSARDELDLHSLSKEERRARKKRRRHDEKKAREKQRMDMNR